MIHIKKSLSQEILSSGILMASQPVKVTGSSGCCWEGPLELNSFVRENRPRRQTFCYSETFLRSFP